jgi:hypothetical protein
MKTIVVHTQKEFNALPDRFDEYTVIEIRSTDRISVTAKGNSQVTARDNSQVTAYDNSQVTACGNSQVTACENSQVMACGNSRVTAFGNSQVTAYDNSQVTAWSKSQVIARNHSQVMACSYSQISAYDNSQVAACNNSQVTAWGNSQVTAWGNSQVTAYETAVIVVTSATVVLKALKHSAVLILDGVKPKLPKSPNKDKTTTVVRRKPYRHTSNVMQMIRSAMEESLKGYLGMPNGPKAQALVNAKVYGKLADLQARGVLTTPDIPEVKVEIEDSVINVRFFEKETGRELSFWDLVMKRGF